MRAWTVATLLGAASLALLALSMAVAAQELGQFPATFEFTAIDEPLGPLIPDGAPAEFKVHWEYKLPNAVASLAAVAGDSAVLNLSPAPLCDSPGVVVTGSLTMQIPLEAGKTNYVGALVFNVVATGSAPGEQRITCTFSGYVEAWGPQGMVPRTAVSSHETQVKVAYQGIVSAQVPVTIGEAGPQREVEFSIHVTNLGNSRTIVQFLASDVPDGWRVLPPVPIVLESSNDGGTLVSREVTLRVLTPHKEGWNNEEATFHLRIIPESTEDPELLGQEVTVNFLARGRGFYCSSPDSCDEVAKQVIDNCPLTEEECEQALDTLEENLAACPASECQNALHSVQKARGKSSPGPGVAAIVLLGALAWARRRSH